MPLISCRQLILALIIVSTDLWALQARSADQPPPQLYLYLNPDPKRGYIEAGEAIGEKVKFRECDGDTFIMVEREQLKPDEGDCRRPSPNRGTWVYVFDEAPADTVILREPNTGNVMKYTKSEWDEKTSKSIDALGTKLETGDYVGVTKLGSEESIFAIEPSKQF